MFIFQLTRPRKARHNSLDFTVRLHLEFQLTRPRKARLQGLIGSTASWNFNSRAHARRDALKEAAYRLGYISTHAPTQGATSSAFSSSDLSSFQLTRPRKARRLMPNISDVSRKFQLTRPRKARPYNSTHKIPHPHISTHAPTQGATSTVFILFVISIFQLTRPRKARLRSWFISRNSITFQLTRPRKARRQSKL